MKNNVYVRSTRSIKSISLVRLLLLLPMIIYGIYKNGIFLYQSELISMYEMFKPIIILIGSALLGALVNIIYEYLIKKSKDNLIDVLFSSFSIEYGILVACIMTINVNIYIYFSVLAVILFISKFTNNRINSMCIAFLIIYIISTLVGEFSYANAYETSRTFALEFMDYLIGRAPGGMASTHILFMLLALFGMFLTNNNKSSISLAASLVYISLILGYSLITNNDFSSMLFSNNFLFIAGFIATDSVTSCYTKNGMLLYGVLLGLLSFIIYLWNPIIAPIIAVIILSLFNNLIDRKTNNYANKIN